MAQKILVVEDTAEVRKFIQNALRSGGFQTIAAADGDEGIRLAREHMPDLILCDVIMPTLDGYETLAALRKDPKTAHIPLIFLTGYSDRPHIRQGMELGADDYLTKPFTLEELLGAVNSRLQKQALIAAMSERKLDELRGTIRFALPHELMTPLTCILGFSAMLIECGGKLPPEQIVEFGGHIHAAGSRLQGIIENFLLYSHLEVLAADPARSKALREIEALNIRPAVDHAIRQVLKQHARAGDLSVEVVDCLHPIAPSHLEKMILELLDNAFKFSASGSPVTLEGAARDGVFQISVRDQGRGMTPEQIKNVGAHIQFERNVHEQQGSGLGLAICKKMAGLYGGALEINSDPGCCTTVRILLPEPKKQG